jgi:hypothetical protein
MLTYILLGLLALVVLLLIVVALQPGSFRIERTAKISSAPGEVFALVNDFRKWQAWSPWENIDPKLERKYSGAAAGTGAVYDWSGNGEVGQGQMSIVESRPDELIGIRLEFFKPFKGVNTTEFTFVPVGHRQTQVTWSMHGPKNFLAKALHMVLSMEKMIGGQYEKGLANLESVVTGQRSPSSPESL